MMTDAQDIAAIEAKNLAHAESIARLCDEKRAENVLILDVRGICNYADFFVLANANNQPQMKAIARDIEKAMKTEELSQLSRQGMESGNWVLLDYGDVLLHLFDEEARAFYQLEDLWGEAKKISVTSPETP